MRLVGFVIIVVLSFLIGGCDNVSNNKNIAVANNPLSINDSIELLTERITIDSNDYTLFLNRANLFLKNGQLDPAFRDVNAALELNQDIPDIYVVLSDLYFLIGQIDNAIASLKKAIDLDPENIQNVIKLARTYILIDDYTMANKYLEYAFKLDMNYAEIYYLKALGKLNIGDTLAALTDMKIAGNLDTNYYGAFMHLGNILSVLGDDEALEYYEKALRTKPNDEKAMFFLARLYQEKGAFNEAIRRYDELIIIHPGNQNVYYNMGYIYLVELENADSAIIAFQEAINIDPGYTDAVYNLGRSYEFKRMYSEARLQYSHVLELSTNYPLAIDALNRLDNIQYGN